MADSKNNYVTQADFSTFKKDMQADFSTFKKDMQADFSTFKKDMQHQLEKMQTAIEKKQSSGFLKLGSVLVSTIIITLSACVMVFAWLFDYKIDWTQEQNQVRFERLESRAISSHTEIEGQQKSGNVQKTPIKKKTVKPTRKVN